MCRTRNFLFIFAGCFFLSISTFGQRTTFTSSVDKDLTIKSIAIAPAVDNVSGIYARPLTDQLRNRVSMDKQWNIKSYPESISFTPEQFEEKPENVKSTLAKTGSDAFISTRISKGPQGISIKMNLFSGKDGLLLAQQNLSDYSGFDLVDLKNKITDLYENLKRKVPYDGMILSRKNLLVTIDLGTNQGLTDSNDLTVVQITKINRHPKFKFVVSSEKEILGKIRLNKVEENLSFGSIVTEREEGVLQPGQKFVVENFVKYPRSGLTADGKVVDELNQRKDNPVSFGDNATEWIPESKPTFGKVGVLFGLGLYQISNNVGAVGGVSATNNITPSIHFDGEMWLNPNWFAEVSLRQYILSVSNPYPGSTPGKLNISTSQYSLMGGYNFLLAEEFFGPKVQLLAGYSSMKSVVDQSTPVAFTNMTYSGIMFGIGGSFPLDLESKTPITLGARLNYFFNPSLDESPTSGNPSNTATSFVSFLQYRYSMRMNIKAQLGYDLFSSSFSGSGSRVQSASSASHAMTTVAGGIEFLF